MKLTNSMRSAFVRAVMADVPKINYQEQILKLMLEDAENQLPVEIRSLWKNEATKGFIRTKEVYEAGTYVRVPATERFKFSVKCSESLDKLGASLAAQEKVLKGLETKLTSVAASCTTRQQLLDSLPEFEKYLPEDSIAACRSLPAITNVVSDFRKAGWPKDTKRKVA